MLKAHKQKTGFVLDFQRNPPTEPTPHYCTKLNGWWVRHYTQ